MGSARCSIEDGGFCLRGRGMNEVSSSMEVVQSILSAWIEVRGNHRLFVP